MNQKTLDTATSQELAAFAESGPGYPTRLAKAIHRRIGMFRDEEDAVQSFVHEGQGGHIWAIDPMLIPDVRIGPTDSPIADSPAHLSDQLLAILFGRWPPGGTPSIVAAKQRPPTIVVRDIDWAEWQAVVDQG